MMTNRLGNLAALVAGVMLAAGTAAVADVPGSSPGRFGGIYKVVSSNDPLFPATQSREYFLDFGRGVQAGRSSGSVAVSVRVNPHVKVRILAWRYFPDQGKIVIGHPFAEGSGNAVAMGTWSLTGASNGVVLQRGIHQVRLRRANATAD